MFFLQYNEEKNEYGQVVRTKDICNLSAEKLMSKGPKTL